ncbi:putative short-chain dehydrogenase [Actinoplanes missouriensis 431]|uniref:Putative short-chain dehydrogenase n=1 Tax=Actinoplanes missouriensis (strain ATCC 14538 / DSM 43046 / CBS 188.64 / JCM 3121 / NBRC 102363 / NCIMB 12654 / NRRL B-3342 / UNCC 431) TaxID=512565 RepID=I0H622_ACTM4|nr:SDR family oxidoreductase [Actinoplanes missouriensis]BAL88459.1 putative short-chain dehydrogenase [Actinoplanes missouriensis 431]
MSNALKGKVALVAGATRGAGRAIARELGAQGAVVYCTGRSVAGRPATGNRPETIEQTAELVTAGGGTGIAVQTDHTVPEQVQRLIQRIAEDQDGRLDILVNDVWGGDELTSWGKPFWEHDLDAGLLMQQRAVHSHIITSHFAAPLMVARKSGVIVEITDGYKPDYRGSLFYDLAKASVIRLALAMSEELRPHGITALAITPGFLRSEAMLDAFGVTEENWRDGIAKDRHFGGSETPHYVGRAVAAVAADPEVAGLAGKTYASWHLMERYGFTDIDGRQPHWENFTAAMHRG